MKFVERFLPRQQRRYESLDISDSEKSSVHEEETDPLQGRRQLGPHPLPDSSENRKQTCLLLLTSLVALSLAVALTAVTTMHLRLIRNTAPPEVIDCGNSIQEAINKGCVFDELSKAWLSPVCPRTGTDEFLESSMRLGNMSTWKYWADEQGTTELTFGQLSQRIQNNPGEKWSWVGTDREHMAHCAYLIIRLAYAHKTGARVDMLTANYMHTKHCTLMMLDRAMSAPGIDDKITRGDVRFGWC
ncbi:hypothetical protein QBC43DRAFT_50377 [Cladorrhinum sp. PSN259]|nr:hypothetical protein QBC43DRAFT_50377 [Cladorrhinum sp. PSN259]